MYNTANITNNIGYMNVNYMYIRESSRNPESPYYSIGRILEVSNILG